MDISPEAFYGSEYLTSETIPDRVTSIEGDAFYDCANIKDNARKIALTIKRR